MVSLSLVLRGGIEFKVFLLAHKLAVRMHGAARQSAENRGK